MALRVVYSIVLLTAFCAFVASPSAFAKPNAVLASSLEADEDPIRAYGFQRRFGPPLLPSDYPPEIAASLSRYLGGIESLFRETLRESDGDGTVFLHISDNTTPDVQMYEISKDKKIFAISRGLLERAKSDDEVVQAMAQELEYFTSAARRNARDPNLSLVDRLTRNVVSNLESDHLALARVIEQGRNPWAALDLYDHLDEVVRDKSGAYRGGGGVGTEQRLDGISAHIVARIRAKGELNQFRIRETAVSRDEVVGLGRSSVFESSGYVDARRARAIELVRDFDSQTARAAYQPFTQFTSADAKVMASFPEHRRDLEHWFNYDARVLWESVSEMIPSGLNAGEKLEWQTAINETLWEKWGAVRKALVEPNPAARTPEAYVYLQEADSRRFLVDLPNPVVARARYLIHRDRLAELRNRLAGAEGKSTDKRATLEAEIRLIEKREETALARFNDAISVYEYDGKNAKNLDEAIAKIDEQISDRPETLAELDRGERHGVHEHFDGVSKDTNGFGGDPQIDNRMRYDQISEMFGLKLKGSIDNAFVRESERRFNQVPKLLEMLLDDSISSDRLGGARISWYSIGYDDSMSKAAEIEKIISKLEARFLRETAEGTASLAGQASLLSSVQSLFEKQMFNDPSTYTQKDNYGTKTANFEHPHVKQMSARYERLLAGLLAGAKSTEDLQKFESISGAFAKLIGEEAQGRLQKAAAANIERLLEADMPEFLKPFKAARSPFEMRQLLSGLEGRLRDRKITDAMVSRAADASAERLVELLKRRVPLKVDEARDLVSMMSRVVGEAKPTTERHARVVEALGKLARNKEWAQRNYNVFDFDQTNRYISHVGLGRTRQERYPDMWNVFRESPGIFDSSRRGFELKNDELVNYDTHRLIDGVDFYMVNAAARENPPNVRAIRELLAGSERGSNYHWNNFWGENFRSRLDAHRGLPLRQRYENASYDMFKAIHTLVQDPDSLESGQVRYHFSEFMTNPEYGVIDGNIEKPSKMGVFRAAATALGDKLRPFDFDFYDGARAAAERLEREGVAKVKDIWPSEMANRLLKDPIQYRRAGIEKVARVLEHEVRAQKSVYGHPFEKVVQHLMQHRSNSVVAEVLSQPAVISTLRDPTARTQLAQWQLERSPEYRKLIAAAKAGGTSLPTPETARSEVALVRDIIVAQFPEAGVERELALDAFEKATLTSRLESEGVAKFRLATTYDTVRPASFEEGQNIANVLRNLRTPEEHYAVVEYMVGKSNKAPEPLGLEKKSASDRRQWKYAVTELRKQYERANTITRGLTLNPFLSETRGILASPSTTQQLKKLLMGKRAENVVVGAAIDSYLKGVSPAEAKVLLTGALAELDPKSRTGVSLGRLIYATGPLGAKGAQGLAQSGSVDRDARADLSTVHNNIQIPERSTVTEDVRAVFGKNANLIKSVGRVRNSGSVNYLVDVTIDNPKTGKTESVLLRLQKRNVGGKVANEDQVWRRVVTDMSEHSNPRVKSGARTLDEVRSQAWENLQPGGRELDMSYENRLEVRSAAHSAYTRSAPNKRTGFSSAIVEARDDIADLIDPEFQTRASFVPEVKFEPWETIKDRKLRAELAKQVTNLEFDAALDGVFDADGHKGNWLVDLKNKILRRTDTAQMNTAPHAAEQRQAYSDILRGLIDPRRPGSRETDRAILENFEWMFNVSDATPGQTAQLKSIVEKTLSSKKFPASHSPLERLLAVQGALEESLLVAADADLHHIKFQPGFRNFLGSMQRIASYSEYAGPTHFASLVAEKTGLDVKALEARIAYQWGRDRIREGLIEKKNQLTEAVRENTAAAKTKARKALEGTRVLMGKTVEGCADLYSQLKNIRK